MADILKISTPIVEKNQAIPPKPGLEPTTEFALQQPNRVIQTRSRSELLEQNNARLQGGDTPSILLDMLKDPDVTVSFLKNISMLEEIYKLLPANNSTVTPGIEQMMRQMLVHPDDLAREMQRQEQSATIFKGPLFDFLRQVGASPTATVETQRAVATLMRSINNLMAHDDILDAVANSLAYLGRSLNSSKTLTAGLMRLVAAYRAGGTPFETLKAETLATLRDVENSILFSPGLAKNVSITTYNLSRYNNSVAFFQEAVIRLRQQLGGPERQQLSSFAGRFLRWIQDGRPTEGARQAGIRLPGQPDAPETTAAMAESEKTAADALIRAAAAAPEQAAGLQAGETAPDTAAGRLPSKVMDALVGMIAKEADREGLSTSEEKRIDSILSSLLSSPCNFTPLLHFVVPAEFEQVRAFAELWINPNSDEKDMPEGAGHGIHLLMVVDADPVGRFEAEVFEHDKIIDIDLYCPREYQKQMQSYLADITGSLRGFSYRTGRVRLVPLEKERSLMDVFKSLPYKRMGVDVRI